MKLPFITPKKLRQLGVVGMNQRNAEFVMAFNKRHLYPLVDDKLRTKQLAMAQGIQVPELYHVFRSESDLKPLTSLMAQFPESVIKPAHGSGGNGILVLDGCVGQYYKKASGDLISPEHIKHHISNIMSGMYSLGGAIDQAILEYKVAFDPCFGSVTYKGVPDIRIIVFRGIPVAGMLRLPTRQSDGKANLHQGAVGAGVDLSQGVTIHGVHKSKRCQVHPDTQSPISGIRIPHWEEILRLSCLCADTVGLGYLGVDIVLDKQHGPMVLELNARPGLSVQLAINQGLYHRLNKVRGLAEIPSDYRARRQLVLWLLAEEKAP